MTLSENPDYAYAKSIGRIRMVSDGDRISGTAFVHFLMDGRSVLFTGIDGAGNEVDILDMYPDIQYRDGQGRVMPPKDVDLGSVHDPVDRAVLFGKINHLYLLPFISEMMAVCDNSIERELTTEAMMETAASVRDRVGQPVVMDMISENEAERHHE